MPAYNVLRRMVIKRFLTPVLVLFISFAAASQDQPPSLSQINQMIRANPNDPSWFFERAQYYQWAEQNCRQAIVDYQNVIQLIPDHLDSFIYMSICQLELQQFSQAEKTAIKGHELFKFKELPMQLAGLAAILQGDVKRAKKHFRKLFALSTKNDGGPVDDLKAYQKFNIHVKEMKALIPWYESLVSSDFSRRQKTQNLYDKSLVQEKNNDDGALNTIERALDNEKSLKVPRDGIMGMVLSKKGSLLLKKGQTDSAILIHAKALLHLEEFGDIPALLAAYTNYGHAHNQGQFHQKAIDNYEKAIAIGNKYNLQKDLVAAYNGLGSVWANINNLTKAKSFYEQALSLSTASTDLAVSQNNLGTLLVTNGQFNDAIEHLKLAATHHLNAANRYAAAQVENNIAMAYLGLKEFDHAAKYFAKAKVNFSQSGITKDLTILLRNIGKLYLFQNKYDQAISAFLEALDMTDKTGTDAGPIYSSLGGAEIGRKNYHKAAQYAIKAISSVEKQLEGATGVIKRGVLSRLNETYKVLSLAHFKNGDYAKSFAANELNRSRVLLQKLTTKQAPPVIAIESIQNILGPKEVLIDFQMQSNTTVSASAFYFPTVITKHKVQGAFFVDSQNIQSVANHIRNLNAQAAGKKAKNDDFGFDTANFQSKGLKKLAVISRFEKALLGKAVQGDAELIISIYRTLIKSKNKGSSDTLKHAGQLLYEMLIKPIEPLLAGKDELIIIPDGLLAYVPFDALIDRSGKYLVEKYKIRYVPSAAIWQVLNQRNYADTRKPFIGFGGPIYENASADDVRQNPVSSIEDITEEYQRREKKSLSMRPVYLQMGISKWNQLPGTKAELLGIKKILPQADIYLHAKADEALFKKMDKSGQLANYKILHFATHGFAYDVIPELSALILNQYKNATGKEDGYLRVSEVEKLNLKADFVALSACQTGMGKIYKGEGVVGLTQAFLLAGANSAAVSLWSVSDQGTAIFMSETYKKVFTENKSFALAMHEVKQNFVHGFYGEQYTHPKIWAPFIYYGR